jgi:hypothetical protein
MVYLLLDGCLMRKVGVLTYGPCTNDQFMLIIVLRVRL